MSEEFDVVEPIDDEKANALIDALFESASEESSYPSRREDLSFEPSDLDYEDDDIIDEDDDEDDDEDEGAVSYMQNRELSWLTFNERVLDQGADESVPLLERLNFISIFWSNLQEFFMVRVGSLTDLSFIEPPAIDSKTGMTPDDQIKAIHERCHELYPIQESTYEHVRGQLAKEGVRHLRPDDLSEEQRNYLFGLVRHNIEPFLSPQIINSRHPFPHLENGKLYILVRLDDEASASERKKKKKKKAKKDKGGAEGVVLGLIPLPHQCERVIKLPGRGYQFILLEHAIEMFVPEIFSMYKIKHTNVICVTRNADIDANQTGDEQDEDYREHMKRLLKKRARLAPVRLECERPLSPVMEKHMLKKLGLKRSQVYDTIVPLDLSFTWGLGSRLSDSKRERLSNPSFTPAWPTCFDRKRRIIDQVADHDVLMSYPYESMDPFVQLLREASNDPDVISIKITLYRLASQSHLAEALIAAADAGKEVTALFELRARFDENNNIEWSQRFEQAGCNVLYGFRDYKVHSKICCITRRTPDGAIQHITQLGTGNYNEKTAKLYTDFSFITVDEAFGRDAVEFFRNMQLENVSDNYEILRVAPLQIKTTILENLDKQIERARQGLPASAFMKANSVTDKDVIEKISEASNAGVRIVLFIRGICCLVPRVKGATENVRVVSIVGRLLEHSRVYCFGPVDDCVVYLSSADLMTRNLNKRVEIAWPLPDGAIRDKVLSYIDVCMHDTAKLRELRPNATYTPLGAFCELDEDGNPKPPFDAQSALIDRAADLAFYAAPSLFEDELEHELAIEGFEGLDDDVDESPIVGDSGHEEAHEDASESFDDSQLVVDEDVDVDESEDAVSSESLAEETQEDAYKTSVFDGEQDNSEIEAEPEDVVGVSEEEESEADTVLSDEVDAATDSEPEIELDGSPEFANEIEQVAESELETEPEVISEPVSEEREASETEQEPEAEDDAEPSAELPVELEEQADFDLAPAIESEMQANSDSASADMIEEQPSSDLAPVDALEEQPSSDLSPVDALEEQPGSNLAPIDVLEGQPALEQAHDSEDDATLETEPTADIESMEADDAPEAAVEVETAENLTSEKTEDDASEESTEEVSESSTAPDDESTFHADSEVKEVETPDPLAIPVIEIDKESELLPFKELSSRLQAEETDERAPEAESSDAEEPQSTSETNASATSDRVSELIAQLSATPGQVVPLQEMTPQPIQSFSAQVFEEALTEMSVAEIEDLANESAHALDIPGIDATVQLAETQTDAPVAEDAKQVQDGEAAEEATQGEANPPEAVETKQTADVAPSTQSAQEDNESVPSFLETPHREINMPPEKKPGFFSRLWK